MEAAVFSTVLLLNYRIKSHYIHEEKYFLLTAEKPINSHGFYLMSFLSASR